MTSCLQCVAWRVSLTLPWVCLAWGTPWVDASQQYICPGLINWLGPKHLVSSSGEVSFSFFLPLAPAAAVATVSVRGTHCIGLIPAGWRDAGWPQCVYQLDRVARVFHLLPNTLT